MGFTMQFLRVTEKGSPSQVSRALQRYPHLCTLVSNPYCFSGNLSLRLAAVRDHAVELARNHALEQAELATRVEQEDRVRGNRLKQKATQLLYRLALGKFSAVGAVRCGSGAVVTEPSDIARILRQHWEGILKTKTWR